MSVILSHVVKEFEDAGGRTVRAVDDVSLEVRAGEFVTLLGPSGCGKTTTLRMIAGFELPTSGTITIDGKDMTRVPAHARDTPMVFQSYALFPHLTVRDNALFGLQMRKIEKARARAKVDELAALMGLSELLDRSPHQLSGGQQQRVALLRALVTEPKVLLFDEPLSNLDARLRVGMRTEIRKIQRRAGITGLYVTHDREEAMVLSDRIVVMESAKIAQVGTPRDVYGKPATRFVATFLGDATFVPGTVVRREGAGVVVDCPMGQVSCSTGSTELAAGAKLELVVRPEVVRVEPLRAGVGARAIVRTVTYLGAEVSYELELAGTPLLGNMPANEATELAEGAEVSLTLDGPVHALAA
ncbi:ABC transporter ATP-binding protein [Myxococcota bacterium]|nr:ABC transporter ATP-binding protein [Myxococcota bacterium]